MNGGVPTSVLH